MPVAKPDYPLERKAPICEMTNARQAAEKNARWPVRFAFLSKYPYLFATAGRMMLL